MSGSGWAKSMPMIGWARLIMLWNGRAELMPLIGWNRPIVFSRWAGSTWWNDIKFTDSGSEKLDKLHDIACEEAEVSISNCWSWKGEVFNPIRTPVASPNSQAAEASFRGAGGRRPQGKRKRERKKGKRKKREKKRKRKKGTMNNVKFLHIKCCFFQFFNSPVALGNIKKFWPPKKKLKWRPWQAECAPLARPHSIRIYSIRASPELICITCTTWFAYLAPFACLYSICYHLHAGMPILHSVLGQYPPGQYPPGQYPPGQYPPWTISPWTISPLDSTPNPNPNLNPKP